MSGIRLSVGMPADLMATFVFGLEFDALKVALQRLDTHILVFIQ